MNAEQFKSDIPLETARQAYSGVSFSPERRADQERDGYAAQMAADYQTLEKLIKNKPDMAATLAAEFERYRQGYRQRLLKKLHSDSRCVSWMIAGPSNFPVRRMEKRNNVAHKRLTELVEFRERALAAITKTLCPELRPIMAGDSDAVSRLQEEIAKAEKMQAIFKEVNAAIRQNRKDGESAQIQAVAEVFRAANCTKQDPEVYARELLKPDFCGRIGFASFELTNNGANIRRMKQRLESLQRAKAQPVQEAQGANARYEDCPPDNRVRLFFPGKPSAEVRSRLKSNGFRWSPTIGAWQAYRNSNTLSVAKAEAGI